MLKSGWISAVILCVLAVSHVSAATHAIIPVLPELNVATVPGVGKTKHHHQIAANAELSTLTEYLLPGNKANGCAVISCPGGAYTFLSMQWEGSRVARWFNHIGVTSFVLKYRLPDGKLPPNGVPWPLQDVRRAVQIVRAHAKQWHINPDDIGVAGFSAGGSAASLAGVHWLPGNPYARNKLDRFSTRPDFLILGYPCISMMPDLINSPILYQTRNHFLGKNPPLDVDEYFSSELNVTPLTPPAFICYAQNDHVVPHQDEIRFYQALKRNGVPAELRVYKLGGHGLFVKGHPNDNEWGADCRRWMERMHFIPAQGD